MGISATDVLIFILLLLAGAFFASAESALTAVSPLRIRSLAEQGSTTAKVIEKLLANRSRMISTLLIGNTIINAGLTVFAALVFEEAFSSLDKAMVATLATVLSVIFLLIFAEVLPKTLAVNLPLRLSLILAWPTYFVCKLLAPVTLLLAGLQKITLALVGHKSSDELEVTGDDLKTMARLAHDQDVLGVGSGQAIERLVDLHEIGVREVMTPRTDIVALHVKASFDDVVKMFRDQRYSRLPVYLTDLDDIVGVINYRDILGLTEEERKSFSLEKITRPPLFVPEQQRVDSLIMDMRRAKVHLAIVVDEYGGTEGLVTLEDLLEEVVGQIEDEYDTETSQIRHVADGVTMVEGGTTVGEVEKMIGVELGEDADTIAGVFLREFGKIPADGDRITFNGVEMTVNRMHRKRIKRLLLRVLPRSGGDEN